MASGTLYTYADSFRAQKILIAAKYSGADVKVNPDFKLGETNKAPEFLSKFPLGKVPAFESVNGECLVESNAIAQYVGNSQLRGSTDLDSARVQQWINFADNEILPASCTWVFPCLGITQYNKQDTERAKEQIKKALTVLNSALQTRTFLVGERISQADISVVCNMLMLYRYVLDPAFRKSFQNVNRWFTTLINQPQFKAVIGDFQLCDKMAEFDNKKYADLHGQAGKKEKKEKQPKQQKPKQEKKEKPPKDDEEDEEAPRGKEPKDPFMHCPKGNFDMDEFKRTYSNKDTLEVAIPYFWDKFEKDNYSIWFCDYQYTKDLGKIFMTCNLVSGMFQRLDKLRKNAFGSMCILGDDAENTISGIWFWRGQDLAFELCPDWQIDYASYSWKKLDPDAEETKKMVTEYFSWEGEFGGRKFNQGKVFK